MENKKPLYNIYWAAHNFCSDNSIMAVVDGDDFLIGRFVLKLFNAIYHRQDAWFVYSNFLLHISQLGFSKDYSEQTKQKGNFRAVGFKMSHQHTFYTKLYRKIREEDLKDDNGEWFKVAYDIAIYFPMAEMSGTRIKHVPIPTYYYDT